MLVGRPARATGVTPMSLAARLGGRCSVLAGDVAHALGRLAEGGSNHDQLAGAGGPCSLRAPCSRPQRSTAALVLDVAQALLGERCGRWRWSEPTTLDLAFDLDPARRDVAQGRGAMQRPPGARRECISRR